MPEPKGTYSEQWSEFIVNTRFEDLPDDVAHFVKRNILNEIGCALGAKGVPSSDIAVQIVSELGGKPESSVFGYGFKTSCANAAFANAIVAYALEMNDDHRLGTGHPAVATNAANLAVAESRNASGRNVLVAQALGEELFIRLGWVFGGKIYEQGFHPTGTCSTFGATACAGKILGLNQQQMVWALGNTGSAAAGLSNVTIGSGVWTKRFHGGHAAHDGIICALLGQKGFTGSPRVWEGIDGKGGFVRAHTFGSNYDFTKLNQDLGKMWQLLDTSVKVHACCAYLAPVVDCALEIALKYNVKPEDVQEVTVKTSRSLLEILLTPKERKYKPQDVVDAQFSIPHGVGVAICRRVASPAEFEEKTYRDPIILEVASKVRGEIDPEADRRYPVDKLATVVVKTKDGKEYSVHTDYPKGDVENPVSDSELEAKFRMLTRKALSERKASEVINMVWHLDDLKDIHQLTDLIIK